MQPLNLSINALARALHVQPMRISEIVNERRVLPIRRYAWPAISVARPSFGSICRRAYELDVASQNADKIAREVQPWQVA